MWVTVIKENRKSSLVEAPDGRRFVLAKKRGVMNVFPEGTDVPVVSGWGLSYKAARRLLEIRLTQEAAQHPAAA